MAQQYPAMYSRFFSFVFISIYLSSITRGRLYIDIQICVTVNRRLGRAKGRAPETQSRQSSPQYSMRKTRQRVGKLYPLRRLLSRGFCIRVDYDFSTNTAYGARAANAAVNALSSEGASGWVVAVVGVAADEEVMLLVVWRCS